MGLSQRTGLLTGRICTILVSALLLGTAANLVSPRRIPWVQNWSHYIEAKALREGLRVADVEQTRRMVEEGSHIILDARPLADYDAGHIPSAFSVPYISVESAFEEVQMLLSPEQPILVYCSGLECDESFLLCSYLKDQGFTNLVLFAGGYRAWAAVSQGQGP
jgi:rhodanese-related sulfurtransferase